MPAHKLARQSKRRVLLGGLCATLMGATGAAYLLNDPHGVTEQTVEVGARRDGDRASRDLDRSSPTGTPTPTSTTTPQPKLGQAPRVVKTTTPPPPRPTRTVTAEPKILPAPGCDSYSGHRLTACSLLGTYGWSTAQMPALDELWEHESGWNPRAENPYSGAYGIPQALPGYKMATAGDDWATSARTQIRWGLGYIKDRYGSPNAAWSFWQNNNWY